MLHKAYPGTVAATTGVAALIRGTTVHDVARSGINHEVRIGHTSGIMPVRARVSRAGAAWQVDEATYYRTARRLAEGTAFIRPTPRKD